MLSREGCWEIAGTHNTIFRRTLLERCQRRISTTAPLTSASCHMRVEVRAVSLNMTRRCGYVGKGVPTQGAGRSASAVHAPGSGRPDAGSCSRRALVLSGDKLIGIVTDRDLAVRGTAQGLAHDEHVESVMTGSPITVQGSDDLFSAFAVLRRAGVRRLPVLEDSDLAGIITVDDLLVWLVAEFAAVASPVADDVLPK